VDGKAYNAGELRNLLVAMSPTEWNHTTAEIQHYFNTLVSKKFKGSWTAVGILQSEHLRVSPRIDDSRYEPFHMESVEGVGKRIRATDSLVFTKSEEAP